MKYIYYLIPVLLVCTSCRKSSQLLTFEYASYNIQTGNGNNEAEFDITTILKVSDDANYELYRRDDKSGVVEIFSGKEMPYFLKESIDELQKKMIATRQKCNTSHELKTATGQWHYINIEERGEPLAALCFSDSDIPAEMLPFIHSFEKVKNKLTGSKTYLMASSVYSRIRQYHDPAGK